MAKPRIKFPKTAKVGQVVQIKTLMSHPMETGLRKNKKTGKKIPRNIINTFTAVFNGKPVFEADMESSVSANTYMSFYFKVPASGEMVFTWLEDSGKKTTASRKITAS